MDFLIDKGNLSIWTNISTKKFYLSLINLLKVKNIPHVQIKLLALIKKWGLKFEDKKIIIPNFYDIYFRLNNNGVEFPLYNGTDYNIYFITEGKNIDKKIQEKLNEKDSFYYFESLKKILKEDNFEHKYRRLVSFLLKLNENIKLANEYIDLKDRTNLNEIINILQEGNSTLINTITGGRLKDDKLMEYTLGTIEDINKTLERDEELKNNEEISKFISYFEINSLIPKDIDTINNEQELIY